MNFLRLGEFYFYSLFNVIIYSLRDKAFREEMLQALCWKFGRKLTESITSKETTGLKTKI
ncbi:unnamed protein product [Clavelina lepadiformis]|uniref:Uncharacterized protein n=1 Tax=Clavelina lepadiformis TaxID=159417 RepID=A0ABP0GR16_CLALP